MFPPWNTVNKYFERRLYALGFIGILKNFCIFCGCEFQKLLLDQFVGPQKVARPSHMKSSMQPPQMFLCSNYIIDLRLIALSSTLLPYRFQTFSIFGLCNACSKAARPWMYSDVSLFEALFPFIFYFTITFSALGKERNPIRACTSQNGNLWRL